MNQQFHSWILRLKDHRIYTDAALLLFSMAISLIVLKQFPQANAVGAPSLLLLAVVAVAAQVSIFLGFGLYNAFWRYTSFTDTLLLGLATFLTTCLTWLALTVTGSASTPLSFLLLDLLLRGHLLEGVRLVCRLNNERSLNRLAQQKGRRTLIYGAGTRGRELAHRFLSNPGMGVNLLGFIDDDRKIQGRTFNGVKIIGSRESLPQLFKSARPQELVIAITDFEGKHLQEVLQLAHANRIRPRLLSDFDLSDEQSGRLKLFRDVELEDLLKRPDRRIDLSSMREMVAGKTVLITGAGGSIGGELARQLIKHGVRKLLALDHSEFNLYEIDHELRGKNPCEFVPLLIDLKDAASLKLALSKHRPEIVFHAAAYKHVHLVEMNPYPAILNNILGARNLIEACDQVEVQTFVLISSDKAVNPVGVMGATKRVCELMITEVARRTGRRYCAVRFGNVLGSSGSFVPLLKKQIRNNEPVTITHEDMTRYFMLIHEAVSLVLKAGSISSPGDINILRMGDPIRIVDIARSLITMVGKTEREVPLVFVGTRPGEKLFEELYLCGDEIKTEHDDILVLPDGDSLVSSAFTRKTLSDSVDRIIRMANAGNEEAISELLALASTLLRTKGQPTVPPEAESKVA